MDKVLRLPPGFRFHPTDEELLEHYLRKKDFRCPLPASIIPDVDLSKYHPSDIPGGASAGFLEKEKYFFAREFARHRSAGCGYWKPTGKDRKITASCGDRVVGVKRVLSFYKGRPSRGSRTNWVMHEYRLEDTPVLQMERWVLCRVFWKRRAKRRAKSSGNGRNTKTMLDYSATQVRENSGSESSCLTELSDESDSEEEACYADPLCPI